MFVWGNLVTWQSEKQSLVARSNAETKFRGMAHRICEGIWPKRLLSELLISIEGPMNLLCDNQAAISITKNPIHHDQTKHVKIDHHFIKEKIDSGIIALLHTPTRHQILNILTKALPWTNFEDLSSNLGMINIYNPT